MNTSTAYTLVMIGVFGHASSEFFAVLSDATGPEVSVWRFVLGAFGLLIITQAIPAARNLLAPLREEWKTLLPLSLLGVTLPYLAFHWSLDFASIVQIGTLMTTIPIFVGITNLLVNRQPLGFVKIVSGLCTIIGVALLVTDGYLLQLAGDNRSLTGIGLALVSAIGVGSYTVFVRPLILRHGALRITTISMSIGAAGLWLMVGTFWSIWVNPATIFAMPGNVALPLLIVGFWNTTITQLCWLMGLAALPDITRGSYLFFLKPVITALLAWLILTQPITWTQLLAIAVICSSVLFEFMSGYFRRWGNSPA
ncbi:MAG: DMT family transporter [Rhizobiales bacterium]|nr:DMT family transporter [Hyphomicrobiales bacterium]